jgi:hypothetical protein
VPLAYKIELLRRPKTNFSARPCTQLALGQKERNKQSGMWQRFASITSCHFFFLFFSRTLNEAQRERETANEIKTSERNRHAQS